MAYPTDQDSFDRPVSGVDTQDSPDAATLANEHSTAIEALESKVGTGSGTPTAGAALVGGSTAGDSEWSDEVPVGDGTLSVGDLLVVKSLNPLVVEGVPNGTYASAASSPSAVGNTLAKLSRGEAITVTTLGDSILDDGTVANDGGTPGTDDAVSQFVAGLDSRFSVTCTNHNRAVSGRTVQQGIINELSTGLADGADLYIISYGHNDIRSSIADPGTGYPKAAFAAAVEHMIRRIRSANPFADVMLVGQNPYTSGSSSNDDLELYNAELAKLARFYGCGWINGYTAFTDLGDYSSYLYDGSHPSIEGNDLYSDAMLALFPASWEGQAAGARDLPVPAATDQGRYGTVGWREFTTSGRTAGTDGFDNAGSWSGTGPYSSSTPGEYTYLTFIGTEATLIVSCGAGTGAVDIWVDNDKWFDDLDLTAYSSGTRRIPFTGLDFGIHVVRVVVASGTITVTGFEALRAPGEFVDPRADRITWTGSWSDATSSFAYNQWRKRLGVANDSFEFEFVGTAVGLMEQRYATGSNPTYEVTVDGTLIGSVSAEVTSPSSGLYGWTELVSGLDYGLHTISVVMTDAGSGPSIAGFLVWDEGRLARPFTQRGVAVASEVVPFAAFPAPPSVQVFATESTTTVPYPSAVDVDTVTVNGEAAKLLTWVAEGDRIAW